MLESEDDIRDLRALRIRMKWGDRYVAAFDEVAGLDFPGSRKPGRSKYEPITLERGVTDDAEFEQWANKVWNPGSGPQRKRPPKKLRPDFTIELNDETGRLARAYTVFRCWVSEYQSLPDLDANANAVTIQHLKLENEGFERDDDLEEPAEPGCDDTPRRG
jgi:phage tail-like protein